MPVWVQVCDLDGTVEIANGAALSISGYGRSEMIGQTWPHPWFPSHWGGGADPFTELRRTGRFSEFETVCTTRQGESKCLGVALLLVSRGAGRPRHVLIVGRDLTEDKWREAKLVQAEKMSAVSNLAFGVAHDINNNLAVILGYSEYLLGRSMNLDDAERYTLHAIQRQAQECAGKVRRIQLFARPVPKSTFTMCSINEVVRDAIELTEPLWRDGGGEGGAGIQVETDLQPVAPLNAHRASLLEALANLINNAVAAVSGGGTVTLRTWSSGEEVELEVADDGEGIEPHNIRRIFDPFFTTKGPASSGLGLSIAHHLITQQGGTLSVESKLGVGTTVRVSLPSVKDQEADPARAGETGQLEVLVVDDEPMVAGMLRTLLESVGHRATVCMGGAEAVDAFQNGEFDLAIVDLAMPGMDGWEVTRRINQMRPEAPVIVATGWNMTVEDGQDQGAVVKAVLKKPFAMAELTGAIDDAVEGGRNGSARRQAGLLR